MWTNKTKPVCVHHLRQKFPASVPSESLPHPLPFAGLSHAALSNLPPPSSPLLAPLFLRHPVIVKASGEPVYEVSPPASLVLLLHPEPHAGLLDIPGAAGAPAAVPQAALGPSYLQVNCRFFPFLLQHFIAPGSAWCHKMMPKQRAKSLTRGAGHVKGANDAG